MSLQYPLHLPFLHRANLGFYVHVRDVSLPTLLISDLLTFNTLYLTKPLQQSLADSVHRAQEVIVPSNTPRDMYLPTCFIKAWDQTLL